MGQQPHPDIEHLGRKLVAAVEGAEDEPLGRQPRSAAGEGGFHPGRRVRRHEAIGQTYDAFSEEFLAAGRDHGFVGNEIIDVRRTKRAGIAEIRNRERRRTPGENFRPCLVGIAAEIHRDVDLEVRQQLRDFQIAVLPHFDKLAKRAFQSLANRALRHRGALNADAIGVESLSVVMLEKRHRLMRYRMISEIS